MASLLCYILIFYALTSLVTSDQKCYERLSINITKGKKNPDDTIEFEGFVYKPEYYWINNGTIFGCPCLVKGPCYRKCCRRGFVIDTSAKEVCVPKDSAKEYGPKVYEYTEATGWNLTEKFTEIYDMRCPSGQASALRESTGDTFYLQTDGSLVYFMITEEYTAKTEDFCLDLIYVGDANESTALVCNSVKIEKSARPLIYAILMMLTVPFLLVIFCIHMFIPELRTLRGKCIACYAISLFFGYLFISIVYIGSESLGFIACILIPIISYTGYMASFMWLNVMCIDVWWTFRTIRSRPDKETNKKKFIIYSGYVWGVTAILLIIVLTLQFIPRSKVPDYIVRPKFGVKKCWFIDIQTQGYYMFGPMLGLIVVNTILFVWTGINIWRAKRDTAKSMKEDSKKHREEGNQNKQQPWHLRQMFIMYIKLFLAFGVNWSLELVPWLFDIDPPFQIVSDIVNTIYPIFVFFISVCNKRVLKVLRGKLSQILSSGSTTGTTTTGTSSSDTHTNSTELEQVNKVQLTK